MTDYQIKADPANYRQLCIPFETEEDALEAINAFVLEVAELRKKHKIADVHIVLRDSIPAPDDSGQEMPFKMSFHLGDQALALPLVAYAYGVEEERQKARIASYQSAGSKDGKARTH